MSQRDIAPGGGQLPPGYSDGRARSPNLPTDGPQTELERESIGELLGGIIRDMQELVRGELQLAKVELKENAMSAGKGIGFLAAAGFLAAVAFTFLMLALVEVLDQWMTRWAAAGIVALGLFVIAGILAMLGKSRLSAENLKPAETIESLQEDKEWAQKQINSVKS